MCTVKVEVGEDALELLTRISESILATDDYHEALDRIIKLTTKEIGATSGSIAIPDSSGNHLKFISVYNHNNEEIEVLNRRYPLSVNEGVAGQAFSRGSIYQVRDIKTSSTFKSVQTHKKSNYNSMVAVPLTVNGEKIGVMSFCFKEKTEISDKNRYLLDIVGNHVAIAMRQGEMNEKLQESNAKLKHIAKTDGLTGLANHRTIHEILNAEFKRARRYKQSLAVIMADVDYFKKINDSHGHPVGDKILEELARVFQEEIRDIDNVGRYGGEEFLFVLPQTEDGSAIKVANRIREKVTENPVIVDGKEIPVTISAGISSVCFPRQSREAGDIIEAADQALYRAKQAGRNCCRAESFSGQNKNYPTAVNFN